MTPQAAVAPHEATRAEIEQRLATAFAPQRLSVRDDSAAHAGHAGAAGGAGHFSVQIVAAAFRGRARLARHRLVYDALQPLMPARIHALSIDAKAPEEA